MHPSQGPSVMSTVHTVQEHMNGRVHKEQHELPLARRLHLQFLYMHAAVCAASWRGGWCDAK